MCLGPSAPGVGAPGWGLALLSVEEGDGGGGGAGRQRPELEEGLGRGGGGAHSSWVLVPPQGVGRRTLQLWAARGAFRMQPGLPPVSVDVLLRSQPIRGRVTAGRLQGQDASCGRGRHAASLRKQRAAGLQTECPHCGQDTVCGSRSAASCCLFKFFLFELQK